MLLSYVKLALQYVRTELNRISNLRLNFALQLNIAKIQIFRNNVPV